MIDLNATVNSFVRGVNLIFKHDLMDAVTNSEN